MDEDKGFVIKDKRRFDSEGNDRAEEAINDSSTAGTVKLDPSVKSEFVTVGQPSEQYSAEGEHSEINFSSFVMSLAMQALMQLGEIAPPDGAPIAKDKQAAKQTIDLLRMLQQKTTGNLSQEEANLVEEILHNLRMSFVRA